MSEIKGKLRQRPSGCWDGKESEGWTKAKNT